MTAASSATSASAASAVTGASGRQPIDPRVGCSTISLRRLPLDEALRKIAGAGFAEIDLGALPGVCDHVPFPLPGERVGPIAGLVRDSGLRVRTVNADVGPLDDPALTPSTVAARLEPLVRLAELTGAPSVTLPCGAQEGPAHEGPSHGGPPRGDEDAAIRAVAGALAAAERVVAPAGLALLVEAPHFSRLCHDLSRALRLREELAGTPVRLVLDTSHVVAGGGDCVAAARAFGDRL
ncbi:sugar phosphate isomerase/epimerase, partial [Streptomyces daliensis]|nr:sugar phosphate isomerase/epimerase [Streptomyces daliensis]